MSYALTTLASFVGWLFGWYVSRRMTIFLDGRKKKAACDRCTVWKALAKDQDTLLADMLTAESQRLGLYDVDKKETIQ